MDPSKSPSESEAHQDRISNLPSIVTDKILKRLPLSMVAKLSVLSTKWRDTWVLHRSLVFDCTLWHGRSLRNFFNIIDNVLLHHSGPVRKFHINIPGYVEDWRTIFLSKWLSFLSRSCVKKVALINGNGEESMSYHLFACKELVKLRLEYYTLNPPPTGFKGFAHLRSLVLVDIKFRGDVFASVIACCPRLTMLRLENSSDIGPLAIDSPSLESLVIRGALSTLHYKSVPHLKRITLCLLNRPKNIQDLGNRIFDSIKLLPTSCEIQYLRFEGRLTFKVLAAGSVSNSLSLAFKHLKELCLEAVDLSNLNEFRLTLGMIQGCPCIENLEISVTAVTDILAQHEIDLDDSYKLNHLVKMKIIGITGSIPELNFLKYMLSIAAVLELLYFKCAILLDLASELNVSRDLLSLRRASAKARLVWLGQQRI